MDFLASREEAIVSRAEVMSTEETGFPLGMVRERRCVFPIGEDAEGKEYDDMDGDMTLWLPFAFT